MTGRIVAKMSVSVYDHKMERGYPGHYKWFKRFAHRDDRNRRRRELMHEVNAAIADMLPISGTDDETPAPEVDVYEREIFTDWVGVFASANSEMLAFHTDMFGNLFFLVRNGRKYGIVPARSECITGTHRSGYLECLSEDSEELKTFQNRIARFVHYTDKLDLVERLNRYRTSVADFDRELAYFLYSAAALLRACCDPQRVH